MSLKQEVLDHYDRMIAWAKTQNPNSTCHRNIMEFSIRECWSGEYCSLCDIYQKAIPCILCPVSIKSGKFFCEETPWKDMARAETWKEWLVAAENEKAFLESLDYEYGLISLNAIKRNGGSTC